MGKDKAKVVKKPKKAAPKGAKGAEMDFRIDDMKFSDEMQPRVGGLTLGFKKGELGFHVVEEHVNEIQQAVHAKTPVQRVQVWRVAGRGNYLTDGHHTVLAYYRDGRKTVPAEVHEGSYEDAKLAASAANKQHDTGPLKRTYEDKRHAVEMCLLALREKDEDWTNTRVADHVGVSDDLVKKMRLRMPKPEKEPDTSKGRVGTDNKVYKKPASRKPKPKKPEAEPVKAAEPVAAETPTVPYSPTFAAPVNSATPAKATEFDVKEFEGKIGAIERELDVLGNVYDSKNDPRVAQVRVLLRDLKAEVLDVNKYLLKKRAERSK